jgi:hypothetical protein
VRTYQTAGNSIAFQAKQIRSTRAVTKAGKKSKAKGSFRFNMEKRRE